MSLLQQVLSRRSFLKQTTQVAALTMLPFQPTMRYLQQHPINSQSSGYGIDGYGNGQYPGAINMTYLPVVSKK